MFRREAFTQIVVVPFGNVLGLLLFCLLISPIFIGCAIDPTRIKPSWAPLFGALFPLTGLATLIIDARVRAKREHVGMVSRWLSPFEGGNVFLIPIWAYGMASVFFYLHLIGSTIGHHAH